MRERARKRERARVSEAYTPIDDHRTGLGANRTLLILVCLNTMLACSDEAAAPTLIPTPDMGPSDKLDFAVRPVDPGNADVPASDVQPSDANSLDVALSPDAESSLDSRLAEPELDGATDSVALDATLWPDGPEVAPPPVRWDSLSTAEVGSICGLTGGRLECVVPLRDRLWGAWLAHGGGLAFPDGSGGWLPEGPFLAVDGTAHQGCAIDLEGRPQCWAWFLNQRPPPEGQFTHVSTGEDFFCGLRGGGEIACWGLVGGAGDERGALRPPAGIFKAIVASRRGACAIREMGEVVCWGENRGVYEGEHIALEDGGTPWCRLDARGEPLCPDGVLRIIRPTPGPFSAVALWGELCALRAEDGQVVCWGPRTDSGDPAQGYVRLPPGPMKALVGLSREGDVAHCSLDFDGFVWCWGAFPHTPYTRRP